MSDGISITQLNIYPVKSCAGIRLQQAQLTATGFAHDREWMIARADGRFVTQREQPRLALISTALDATGLTLRAPGMQPLIVPFDCHAAVTQVKCWDDLCAAFDTGSASAEWLSDYLGAPHRLLHFDGTQPRPSSSKWTQGVVALNQFTDGYPWLVISEASLADLNSRLAQPLPMNRFRPNIVIVGVAPYDEDRILELSTGAVTLRIVKPCARCAITTTNQETGTREGDEPLQTLRGYRFDRQLKGILFGQNAIAVAGLGGQLTIGDTLTATWRAE